MKKRGTMRKANKKYEGERFLDIYCDAFTESEEVGVQDEGDPQDILILSTLQYLVIAGLTAMLTVVALLCCVLSLRLIGILVLIAGSPLIMGIPKRFLPWKCIRRNERYYVRQKVVVSTILAYVGGFILGVLIAFLVTSVT